jgi:hypothetical protein
MAIATAYGVMKFLNVFPARISAVFIGSWALFAWLAYNVLSVFVILPFSASLPLTIAASLVIGMSIASLAVILGVTIMGRPRMALVGILCMIALLPRFIVTCLRASWALLFIVLIWRMHKKSPYLIMA